MNRTACLRKILIIDDDQHIGDMLEEALRRKGYGILRAYSGTEALYVLDRETPDLVLLDLMLPGLDGEKLLPGLSGIPVIVVSAKADVESKVSLLLGGAVDYVTKPLNLDELLARISVHLRTAEGCAGERGLRFGRLVLDLDAHRASLDGQTDRSVRLTRTEFAILKLLMQNPLQVLSKSLLLERIEEDTPDCTESSLKMHISNLRKKLRELDGQDHIEAVWGIGFRLKADDT